VKSKKGVGEEEIKKKKRIEKHSDPKDSPCEKERKYLSRFHSIQEGIFCSVRSSFGDRYIAPFAIAINTSNSAVAMLTSLSGLFGPLSQMFGSKLMESNSRKKILRRFIFYESFIWLFFLGIVGLFYFNLLVSLLPVFLLLFFAIYMSIAHIPIPAWFSWMGDLVNEKYRGRWFSKRTFIIGFTSVILAIASAIFLDLMKERNFLILGFGILFFLAFLARLYSWKTFKKMYEPELKLKKSNLKGFGFWDVLLNYKKDNFSKFVWFRFLLSFGTFISAPLFAVYLLRYLGFSYLIYMAITLAATVFSLLVIDLWGVLTDKFGNYEVLILTAALIPMVPLLWMISPSAIYLMVVPALVGGIAWAGFNLAAGNFIYDNIASEKRGIAVSYYNVLNGLGVFFGAGLGALLIKYLTIDFITPIFAIFIISAAVRLLAVVFLLPKVKEIRKIPKIRPRQLGRMVLKYARPTLVEEGHEIVSIRKYLWK